MKIYVSDKEIDNSNLNYVEDDFVEEYWLLRGRKEEDGFEVHDDVGLVEIQSLEQHNKELLKEFADKLLEFIKDKSYVFDGESLENFRRNSMYTRTATLIDEIKFLLKKQGVK